MASLGAFAQVMRAIGSSVPQSGKLIDLAPTPEDPSIVLDNVDNRPNNFEYYDVINQTIYPVYTRAL